MGIDACKTHCGVFGHFLSVTFLFYMPPIFFKNNLASSYNNYSDTSVNVVDCTTRIQSSIVDLRKL